jgi:uncharacterized membrane protein YoaK (UPF0700 family)
MCLVGLSLPTFAAEWTDAATAALQSVSAAQPPLWRKGCEGVTTPLQRDPLPIVLVVLTATTGLVDAISVLGLGRVFTANMTGNVVFWGFAAAGAPGFSIARCATALAGFLAGAALGGRIGVALSDSPRRRWLLTVAVVETGMLVAAALVATGYDADTLAPVGRLYALIAVTAVAMGLRNATVRQLAVPDLTTTVLTLTLTGLAADSSLAGGSNPRWVRRLASVVSIFVGSVVGAWLVYASGLALPLVVAGACILLVTVAYAAHPASATAAREAR